MDPLCEVLNLMHPGITRSAALDAAGPWSLRFPPAQGIKFCSVERGVCWIAMADGPYQRLESGDCFVLSKGWAFVVSNDPTLTPVDAYSLITPGHQGVKTLNGGGDELIVSCQLLLDDDLVERLLDPLPAMVRVEGGSEQGAALRSSLTRLTDELVQPKAGGALVIEHLVRLLLVDTLRLFLQRRPPELPQGWLQALSDAPLGLTIQAMHERPTHAWTVAQLAALAGMSRAVFARRFKAAMGLAPIEYLGRWRMLRAASLLRSGNLSIARVAERVGYSSEYAFITAFTRVMGCPPGRYRRQAKHADAL
ncbi:AraC family transcriptional regulator [Pseudomonas sp. Teo4]|uniref:AraC family transcriptional regulator n=1 Tax=Pseudomonas sp. Teo4 TaxID=3064528 RepID=UPI002AB9A259|nr:AraC family transcriptional regulator [Pseudomonas sp. Teo4]MDZ3992281.1 IS5 family transposase IS4811 [Pseudomonas sp. Teo4]